MKKIGIVYAISRLAGEECKKQVELCAQNAIPIINHECSPEEYKAASTDVNKIAKLLEKSIHYLAEHGANVIIIAANSVHRAFSQVSEHTKKHYPHVQLISIIEVAVKEIVQNGYRTVSVFASNSTLNSGIYQKMLAANKIVEISLHQLEQDFINSLISSGISPATITASDKQKVVLIAERLKKSGCDAVVLACTELGLIFNSSNLNMPVVDTSRSLAKEAVKIIVNSNDTNHILSMDLDSEVHTRYSLRSKL